MRRCWSGVGARSGARPVGRSARAPLTAPSRSGPAPALLRHTGMRALRARRNDARMPRLHEDVLLIDVSLVRRLVDRAFPQYAGALAPLRLLGSSNALFRLGNDLLVRLPRQPGAAPPSRRRRAGCSFVGQRVTAAVPTILGLGEPDLGYSERWAVTTWVDGAEPAPRSSRRVSGTPAALAKDLAQFVAELRAIPVPPEAAGDESLSWYRGMPLSGLDAEFRDSAAQCRSLDLDIDIDEALRVWDGRLTLRARPNWLSAGTTATCCARTCCPTPTGAWRPCWTSGASPSATRPWIWRCVGGARCGGPSTLPKGARRGRGHVDRFPRLGAVHRHDDLSVLRRDHAAALCRPAGDGARGDRPRLRAPAA